MAGRVPAVAAARRHGRARPVGGRRPGAGGRRGVPPPRAGGRGHVRCSAGCGRGPDGGARRAGGQARRVVRYAPAAPGWMALVALHALARGVIPVVVPDSTDHLDAELGAVSWPVAVCLGEGASIRSWPRPLIEIPVAPLGLEDRGPQPRRCSPELEPPSRPAGPRDRRAGRPRRGRDEPPGVEPPHRASLPRP